MLFQYVLVLADVDDKILRLVLRRKHIERRIISLLKDKYIQKRFQERVTKLFHIGILYT